MTRHIIVGDTHLGFKSTIESFDLTLRLFREICDFAFQREIPYLIHLGDFFDKKSISFKMLEYINEIRDLLEQHFTHSYLIVGNHDTYYKDRITPNGLSIFYSSSKLSVIEEPYRLNNKITLFPWVTTENIEELRDVDTEYLLGHFAINNILINRYGTLSKDQVLNKSDLNKFKVISGHFHQPSENSNITYIGSPYHVSFNDSGDRGYYVFDDELESLEFIRFNAPKFTIISPEIYNEEDVNGNHVRIDFNERWSNSEIEKKIKEVESFSPISVSTKYNFSVDIETDEEVSEEVEGNKDIMNNYLDNIENPKGIKDSTLKSIMNNLYDECIST